MSCLYKGRYFIFNINSLNYDDKIKDVYTATDVVLTLVQVRGYKYQNPNDRF